MKIASTQRGPWLAFVRAGTLLATAAFGTLAADVSYERILKADSEPGSWLTYSRTYNAQRFSPLKQINSANVAELEPKWMFQFQTTNKVQTTPLMADGIMYLTRPPERRDRTRRRHRARVLALRIPGEPNTGAVRAIDPRSGEIRWEHPLISRPYAGLMSTAGNLVFGGTEEGHVIALDATTGKHLWHFPAGGAVRAPPISYSSGGKQVVAISAGDVLIAFGLKD